MKNLTSVVLKNSKRNELTNRSKVLIVIAFIIVFGFVAGIMIAASLMAIVKLAEIRQSYAFVNFQKVYFIV